MARTISTIRHKTFVLSAAAQDPLIVTVTGGIETKAKSAIIGGAGTAWTIDNAGTITSIGADAIDLLGGGLVGNTGSIGSVSGVGVAISGGNATVVNAGRIGGATDAVLFGGAFDDRVVADPGAVFAGVVAGGSGSNTLELAAGTPGTSGLVAGIGSSFTNFGTLDVDAGSLWWLDGDNSLGVGSQLANAGTLDFAGGTGTHDDIINGNFYGVPNKHPYGALLVDKGTITNTGSLGLAGGGGDYDDAFGVGGTGATLVSTGLITNSGRIGLAGGGGGGPGGVYTSVPATGAVLLTSGTLNNSGTITAGGGGGGGLAGAGGNPYVNPFGVASNGGYGAILMNSGQLTNTGRINLIGGSGGSYFAFRIASGFGATLLNTGTLINAGYMALTAGGHGGSTNSFGNGSGGGGAFLLDSGLLTNTGAINILGAVSEGSPAGVGTGGFLQVSGRLINSGAITVQGGTDSGTIKVEQSGNLTNTGTIYLEGGGYQRSPGYGANGISFVISTGGLLDVDGVLANAGTIVLEAGTGPDLEGGGVLNDAGTVINTGTITGFGTLYDQGLLTTGSAGTTGVISTTSLMAGDVQVAAMTELAITSAVASGMFSLAANSTLSFTGSVTGLVDFTAAGGVLELGAPVTFAAMLQGVQAQTTIDFLKQDVTGASVSGTTLAVDLQNGTVLDLALAQPVVGLAPSLHGDGLGGTDLLFTAAGGG